MTPAVLLLAVLTNAAQLSEALQNGLVGERFDIVGTVQSDCTPGFRDFGISDSSGSVVISALRGLTNVNLRTGTQIRARGTTMRTDHEHVYAGMSSWDELGKTETPPPPMATFDEILSGRHDARYVSVSGTLRDYFSDEIDPSYVFLILNSGNKTLYAACHHSSSNDLCRLDSLIGHELALTGLCDPRPSGCRRKIGRLILISSLQAVRNLTPITDTPFSAPLLTDERSIQATDLSNLGRRKTWGQTLAVWQGNCLLIKTKQDKVARVNLAKGPLPAVGGAIEVVGFPETDLYRINFSQAIWRPASSASPLSHDAATNIAPVVLTTDERGQSAIRASLHGRTVRLRGTVRSLPSVGNDGRFYLESDGYTLPVDISANPVLAERLEIGSVIDVTGVCVMDIENWRPNLVFPHIKEVMIVTRTPEDIVVVKRPPWWTPARLSIVIGSLLAALLGILIWNRALKALAEKRGKALANEELERLESDLKVCERTRLAVELHDSIAQNLTGVSMGIDTALRGDEPLPPSAAQHMGRALRTIDSCRGELRNCLWDLRSQALEEEDMNKAIRLTLSQTIGKTNLSVRFNVPRSRFTDNTAHTLLRIIRELAANAVRHGHATEIKVAGSIEDNILKFSVRDNGCGFDPDACPGVLDGHFGLQGVRERVASFEGSIRIESAPGKGTRVSVSINTPQTDDKEKI